MKYPVMRVRDPDDGEFYWLTGHDKESIEEIFGERATAEFFWAVPVEEMEE